MGTDTHAGTGGHLACCDAGRVAVAAPEHRCVGPGGVPGYVGLFGPGRLDAGLSPMSSAPVSERLRLARTSGGLSPDVWWLLGRDAEVSVRAAVAANRCAPPGVLEVLAADVVSVRTRVASNGSTPEEVLEVLAGDGEVWVRQRVAARAGVGAALLSVLAGDGARVVRAAVAANRCAPAGVLGGLSTDGCWEVRAGVASNAECCPVVLDRLAFDGCWEVRAGVASNRAVWDGTLVGLAGDLHGAVRARAFTALEGRVGTLERRYALAIELADRSVGVTAQTWEMVDAALFGAGS